MQTVFGAIGKLRQVVAWVALAAGLTGLGLSSAYAQTAPAEDFVFLGAGANYTCGIKTGGSLRCWGVLNGAALSTGGLTYGNPEHDTPALVPGLTAAVKMVAGEINHTCVLTEAGAVMCWGWDPNGSDNINVTSPTPVTVAGLSTGVAAISKGAKHSCALTTGGAVKCWGWNNQGQLGNHSTVSSATPVDVVGLSSGVTAIASHSDHNCAVTANRKLKCWGDNRFGQLGHDASIDPGVPMEVAGLSGDVLAVATGDEHTCVVLAGGGVQCWGNNEYGQLGDNTDSSRSTPADVVGLSGAAVSISAGDLHTCVVDAQGGVQCWGYARFVAESGYSEFPVYRSARPVPELSSGVRQVAAGYSHTCALLADGRASCWGWNGSGQLGDNSSTISLKPVAVLGLASETRKLAAGYGTTCALSTAGRVQCWGGGYIGDGKPFPRLSATQVSGLDSGALDVAVGASHSCAVTAGGGAVCWGANDAGQLGDGTTTASLVPMGVYGLSSGVIAVAVGDKHSCALSSSNAVYCWGANDAMQLGNNSTVPSLVPVPVAGLSGGVVKISARGDHACAVTTSHQRMCWGANAPGVFTGGGYMAYFDVEVGGGFTGCWIVQGGSFPAGIECGGPPIDHYGNIYTWPSYGDSEPTKPIAFAAGGLHACNIVTGGIVGCWGDGQTGQLGDGYSSFHMYATRVEGLPGPATAIAAGSSHSCAAFTGGGVQCWGNNYSGQLGNGSGGFRATPALVVNSVPDAPRISGGAAGAGSASLDLVAQHDGGLPIDGYRVTCNPGGITGESSTTHVVVTGLVNGQTYSCTAAAHNSLGWSDESSSFGPLKPSIATPPSPPSNVVATPHDRFVLVSFTPPVSPGTLADGSPATIISYTAYCGPRLGSEQGFPILVDGLVNGVSYTCTVVAISNGPLISQPSAPSAPVTPFTTPDAPVISSVSPGVGSATISFVPGNNNGANTDSFRATCNPGAITASDAASPISVPGLSGGVSYSCSVAAHNAAGWGPASTAASVTPANAIVSYSAPSATGTGNITATFTGGGPTCSFSKSRFIPPVGDVASPPAGSAPAGVIFTHGLFDFVLSGCTAGSSVSFTLTYPQALPAGTNYWKYGPTLANTVPHWYVLPATIVNNQISFTLTDGGLGDDDLSANGSIVDQGGPGSPAGGIPTISLWALCMLALGVALLGSLRLRRSA